MNHRKILGILLGLSILGVVSSLAFSPGIYSFCRIFQSCTDSDFIILNIAHPLVLGLIPLLPILVILIILPRAIFNTWKRFAIFLIPISIVLITITPVQCSAPLGMCFDKIVTAKLTSISFAIISLIIIIYKSVRIIWASRKSKRI